MYMTKVSWKRILQRAGNDLPSNSRPFAEHPHLQPVPRVGPRPVALDDGPAPVAGELESELRRALQRAKSTSGHEPAQQGWDPIFMAQELRQREPVTPVPTAHYMQSRSPSRSKTTRNLIAASLSAMVVGFAVHQFGGMWQDSEGDGGGGGGNGGGGGQYRSAEQASLGAPMKAKSQGQLVETGYAIQPLVNAGSPTDLGPVEETPRTKSLLPQEPAVEAASTFKRDMEEARKLFDRKEEQVAPARAPEVAAEPTPAAPPAQIAAVAPSRVAPPVAEQPAASGINSAEESKMMQRASDLMQRGDITGARLLFEHIARRGSAIGAFALAQSYDQKYLQKLYVRGLAPDAKQADYWYRRAAELGGTADSGKRGR
jgi:hypothetical protein